MSISPLIQFDYLDLADEFMRAFRNLPPGTPPSWPRYFLLCHSIELALKAYLAAQGVPPSELKNTFGHDLKELLTEAIRLGLAIDVPARTEIELLNEAHTKYWPRYPREDAKPVFVIDHFEPYAAELLQLVRSSIQGF